MLRLRLAILLALVAVATPVSARAASWPEIEPLVRAQLRATLSDAEIARLLGSDRVRLALMAAFGGWDGDEDAMAVVATDDGVEVQVRIASRQRVCTTTPAGEGQKGITRCADQVITEATRRTSFESSLWRPPAPPKPRPKPPTPPPQPPLELPEGVAPDTVLRRPTDEPSATAGLRDGVHAALSEYATFLDTLREPHWKDPFLPPTALEAGVALRDVPLPERPTEPSAMAGLRNPFSEGRMGAKLDIPAPAMLSLEHGESGPIKEATAECLEQWAVREGSDHPPELDCFRRVAHNDRLAESPIYKLMHALDSIGLGISIPILDQLLALEAEDAATHKAHMAVWAMVWLDWIDRQPNRFDEAARDLTEEERKYLRRRVWRWWVEPRLAPYHDRITRLYEQHFLVLYPEAKDALGLPRRSFFGNTYLWASNWLSEADRRPTDAVVAAYHKLGPRERAVIDDFVAEPMLAARFPTSCGALRGR